MATTVALPPSSLRIRSIMPSASAAVPKIRPDWIASIVLRPIGDRGAWSSTCGSRAVSRDSDVFEVCTPGAIAPPRNSPLSETTS